MGLAMDLNENEIEVYLKLCGWEKVISIHFGSSLEWFRKNINGKNQSHTIFEAYEYETTGVFLKHLIQ